MFRELRSSIIETGDTCEEKRLYPIYAAAADQATC
jgi:hypothetical protein